MKICERPSIELMIERVKRVKKTSNIILATTNKKCDNELVEIAKNRVLTFSVEVKMMFYLECY